MNATDQVLCDIEEGKSLAEAGGNAFVTLTYERFSDKAAGRLPTPGGDPADKVGFTRKARDNYEGYEGWTPKKRDRIHPPKRREHTRPPQQVVQGGEDLKLLGEARRAMNRNEDFKSYAHQAKQDNSDGSTGLNQNSDLGDAVLLEYYKDWLDLQKRKRFRK